MADNNAQQVYLGAAALAISLVALFATVLQLMQQFILTADGYHRVGESVMDYWGKSRKLRWDFQQFRVEVNFETPVILVCPPTNKRFPAGDKAWFIDSESRLPIERDLRRLWDRQSVTYFVLIGWWKWMFGKREWWWEKDEAELEKETGSAGVLKQFWQKRGKVSLPRRWTPNTRAKARVNTTRAELTSWVRLLDGIQAMEEQSAKWQSELENSAVFPPTDTTPLAIDRAMRSRTMSVALQPYNRSWDTMPTGLIKPYATTTMCHLVEMLAMLNVYWEEFDRSRDRYRAQGNGFLVTGVKVGELGLTFTINQYGKNRFEENRVIPDDGVKDLCFGRVDTIFSWAVDSRRLEPTEIENLGSMQLSTDQEVGETLRMLGCNTKTINLVLQKKRTTHLFPLVFELIGMLSRTFHMDNTLFRFIPNPTKFMWDRQAFSTREMLYAYEGLLAEHCEAKPSAVKSHLLHILYDMQPFLARFAETRRQPLEPGFLQLLHHAIDGMDEILTAKRRGPRNSGPATTAAGTSLNVESRAQEQRREMVQDVLRNHIQTVLYVLNRDEEDLRTPRMSKHTMSVEFRYDAMPEHLMLPGARAEDIDNAPPEGDRNKQKVLMDIYFLSIRQFAVDRARGTTDERTKWEASPRRDFLTASPAGRHIARALASSSDPATAAAAAAAYPPKQGIQRAPTEPTPAHSTPHSDEGVFRPPGAQRTWTLPSRADTGSGSSDPLSMRRASAIRRQLEQKQKPVLALQKPPVKKMAVIQSPATTEATQKPGQQSQKVPNEGEAYGEKKEKENNKAGAGVTINVDGEETTAATTTPACDGKGEPESLADIKDVTHDDVWCVLVLRMLCWLTLHEFHKKDRQIPNSELLGSRLPVFIA